MNFVAAAVQEEHSEAVGPVHFTQSEWHALHTLSEVSRYSPVSAQRGLSASEHRITNIPIRHKLLAPGCVIELKSADGASPILA